MNIQLQSILDPDKNICNTEALYFHRNGSELYYDGYFNLFYIEKWKRYTNLEHLKLNIKVKGYHTLRLYHNRKCIKQVPLQPDILENHLLDYPFKQYNNGVFWFSLVPTDNICHCYKEGFFVGSCQNPQNITLGVDICTYKREACILRSLKLLCEKILGNNSLQVSERLWVYIIDNGKTLNQYESIQNILTTFGSRISVIPNRNAGGVGGFTRGMLEILDKKEEKGFTHILLMDDDAMPNPDLFVRVHGFLSMLRDKWNNITMGGTMFYEDHPYMLYASGEEWQPDHIVNQNKNLDMRKFENSSCEQLLTTRFEKKLYSAWWCCCYSLNIVREDNLPLPLFIHHDDIEFGLRNQQSGVVFLNGVNVWHKSFDHIPIGSNLYYDIRNNMIGITQQYALDQASKYIWQYYWKRLAGRLLRGNRVAIYWTIRSADDFLKGPRWLCEQDSEQVHNKIKNPELTNYVELCYEGIKICLKLLCHRKKIISDYQKIRAYSTKQMWIKYLKIERGSRNV